MKNKKQPCRIKITYINEEGEEISREEEMPISEYKTYEEMEKRIVEIEKESGKFLREEALKKKKLLWWKNLWKKIRNFFGMGKRQ